MIRSLVGRGVRRMSNSKKPEEARGTSAPIASWTPTKTVGASPSASEPTADAALPLSDALDWVDDVLNSSPPSESGSEQEATPTVGGGTSFSSIAAQAAMGNLDKAVHADASSTDIEAYKARARANGRAVELAGEGMNLAGDGAAFWGPVDNESGRARAAGLTLTINQHDCISCGTCEENTDKVFLLPEAPAGQEEDKAEVLKQEGPMDLIQDAIDACPVTCINWLPGEELHEGHSHGGYDRE